MRGQILADPHTLLAYRTISGEGFRVIFRYSEKPVQSVSDYQPPENALSYRAAYRKGNEYFATLCGVDYDGQCGDLTRLSGMAHDPEAYLNTEAMPFIITDDEAAAANLSADTEPGKRRREYAVGTYHADADEAWTVIEPMLTKRNLSYGPGSHHQYVMHAAHLFNRFGTSIDTMQEWAAQNWSDYDQKEREGIIWWVYDAFRMKRLVEECNREIAKQVIHDAILLYPKPQKVHGETIDAEFEESKKEEKA